MKALCLAPLIVEGLICVGISSNSYNELSSEHRLAAYVLSAVLHVVCCVALAILLS